MRKASGAADQVIGILGVAREGAQSGKLDLQFESGKITSLDLRVQSAPKGVEAPSEQVCTLRGLRARIEFYQRDRLFGLLSIRVTRGRVESATWQARGRPVRETHDDLAELPNGG